MNALLSAQPMSVIEIFWQSLRLYRRGFWAMIVLTLIGAIPPTIIRIAALVRWGPTPTPEEAVLLSIAAFYGAIFGGFIILPSVLLLTALYANGMTPSLWQILSRFDIRTIAHVFLSTCLSGLVVFAGFIALIIPGIMLNTYFTFVPIIVVIEDKTYANSMDRSIKLVRDCWWRVFGATLLIEFCCFFLPYSAELLLESIASVLHMPWIIDVSSDIIFSAFDPLYLLFLSLLYYDLRIRKEAFDIDAVVEAI